jgi:hypothetical protein
MLRLSFDAFLRCSRLVAEVEGPAQITGSQRSPGIGEDGEDLLVDGVVGPFERHGEEDTVAPGTLVGRTDSEVFVGWAGRR